MQSVLRPQISSSLKEKPSLNPEHLPVYFDRKAIPTGMGCSSKSGPSVSIVFEQTEGLTVSISGHGELGVITETGDETVDASTVEDGAALVVTNENVSWIAIPDADSTLKSLSLNGEAVEFGSAEEGFSFTIAAGTTGKLEAVFDAIPDEVALSPEAPEYLALETTDEADVLYLTGLTATTEAKAPRTEELLLWLDTPGDELPTVTLPNGEAAKEESIICTGMTAAVASGDAVTKVVAIVKGDVVGTGLINISQLTRLARAMNGTAPLEGVDLLAGDLNGSGSIDIADLVSEAKMISSAS